MKLIYVLIICILLSGCGLFKSVNKQKQSSSTETELRTSKDSTSVTIDKSVTTIREITDTTVVIPARSVSQATVINKDSLVKGVDAIKSDLVDVKLLLDPLTGVLTALATVKQQYVPVKINKVTTTENNVSTNVNTKEATLNKTETKQSSSSKKKEPAKMGIWLIAFGVLVAVVLVIGWIRKKT